MIRHARRLRLRSRPVHFRSNQLDERRRAAAELDQKQDEHSQRRRLPHGPLPDCRPNRAGDPGSQAHDDHHAYDHHAERLEPGAAGRRQVASEADSAAAEVDLIKAQIDAARTQADIADAQVNPTRYSVKIFDRAMEESNGDLGAALSVWSDNNLIEQNMPKSMVREAQAWGRATGNFDGGTV